MVQIKQGTLGADMEGVNQELYDIFDIIDTVWEWHGLGTPVITSGIDRDQTEGHVADSWHHYGGAIDIRARDMGDELQDEVAHDLQYAVGPMYHVISEHFPNPKDWKRGDINRTINNHIHISIKCSVYYPNAQVKINPAKQKEE